MKNTLKLSVLAGITVTFSMLFSSCNDSKYSYSDDSKSIEIPLQDMLPKSMTRAILTNSYEVTIPIQLNDKQGNKLEGADFIIAYEDNNVYLKSDTKGVVPLHLIRQF